MQQAIKIEIERGIFYSCSDKQNHHHTPQTRHERFNTSVIPIKVPCRRSRISHPMATCFLLVSPFDPAATPDERKPKPLSIGSFHNTPLFTLPSSTPQTQRFIQRPNSCTTTQSINHPHHKSSANWSED